MGFLSILSSRCHELYYIFLSTRSHAQTMMNGSPETGVMEISSRCNEKTYLSFFSKFSSWSWESCWLIHIYTHIYMHIYTKIYIYINLWSSHNLGSSSPLENIHIIGLQTTEKNLPRIIPKDRCPIKAFWDQSYDEEFVTFTWMSW